MENKTYLTPLEKIDEILKRIDNEQRFLGRTDCAINIDNIYSPRFYNLNSHNGDKELPEINLHGLFEDVYEGKYLFDLMENIGYVERTFKLDNGHKILSTQLLRLTSEAYKRILEINEGHDSKQVFIARWFDKSMNDTAAIIRTVVEDLSLIPCDLGKEIHNENIISKIKKEIKRSKFVIADLTGHRGGVYWEAGYACGLGINVVHTIKESDFENLHFDLKQTNFLKWKHKDNLKEKLSDWIEGSILTRKELISLSNNE